MAGVSFRADSADAAKSPKRAPDDPLAGATHGHWRRLFLDGAVVEQQQGLTKLFHRPEKHAGNPVIVADRPWEGAAAVSGPYVYGTVLSESGRLRLWYQILNKGNHVGYAESTDGFVWKKPELGLIPWENSKANNLVVSAANREATGGECHNPSVLRRFEDGAKDSYALYGFDPQSGHARVAFSPDGLRWRFQPETEQHPLFASSDVVNFFADPYRSRYAATWKTRNRRGRAVGIVWSDDGLRWAKPLEGPVFVADDLDPDATQIYGMPVFAYQGLYIGLPWVYHARYFRYGDYSVSKLHEAQEGSPRTVDVQLAWSWDLLNWTRAPSRPTFLQLGPAGAWDSGMIYTARAPVLMGNELFFYYGGCNGVHDAREVKAAIGVAKLRLDGFCCLQAGAEEGWFVSRREPFRTPGVTINARTAPGGYISAEIIDRRNRVVPGFSRQECVEFAGDATAHLLRWRTDSFPSGSKENDYKLRFLLRNAELYSYLPAGLDPAQPDLARF